MTRTLSLLILAFGFFACSEDVEREIQTDLTIESQQLFRASMAWGESNYFALIPLEKYQQLDSAQLPGCPLVTLDLDLGKVTLDFDQSYECEQSGPWTRAGKIHIDFTTVPVSNPTLTLTYEDYSIAGMSLKGSKMFTRLDSSRFRENADQLVLSDTNNQSHYFSISANHTLNFDSLSTVSFISTGTLEGINPAGRNFQIDLGTGRPYLETCLESNWLIPISGQETWEISRGESSSVGYLISFGIVNACEASALATFPDGRTQNLTF